MSSAAMVALAQGVPQFLLDASAQAAQTRGETILVVIQLSGGNDGLNTVIPYRDDAYRRNRPLLGIPAAQVRKIDGEMGLHPAMGGFSKLLEEGCLGIVQGAGYPVPDRSHFSSMDIWQTARREITAAGAGYSDTGWIGRYLDQQQSGRNSARADVPAIHLPAGASRLPLALSGRDARATSVQSLDSFKLDDGGSEPVRQAIHKAVDAPREGGYELVAFLHQSSQAALESSRQVQEAIRGYQTDVKYPQSNLAARLNAVAQLVHAGLGTRIYYLDLDGFDTHSNQSAAHAGLLGQLSDAVTAFVEDLKRHDHGQRVLVMTFSEFGRRVHENASGGTDHGTAAPMFVAGGKVKPGLLTPHPSINDLDEGDLRFTTDFRSVYAAVLEQWLGIPSAPILGGRFEPVKVLA